jgi:Tol biopolymer transport system component
MLLKSPCFGLWAGASNGNGRGFLLYVEERRLMAREFDADRLRFSGTPAPILQNVTVDRYGVLLASVSNNGILTYGTEVRPAEAMTLLDRSGRPERTIGPPGIYGDPVLSPDGTRVAVDRIEGGNQDIWMADVATGAMTRMTFEPEIDHVPQWTPDGGSILFDSHRSGTGDLFIKNLAEHERRLLTSAAWADDVTRDGKLLVFSSFDQNGADLWTLPLSGGQAKPAPLLRTKANEKQARLSPDNRWIVYASNESGRNEVYVRRFQGAMYASDAKWQISDSGGGQPAWRGDGKELYYLAPGGELISVDVQSGSEFKAGIRRVLFRAQRRAFEGPRNDYAVERDGRRFLFIVPAQKTTPTPIHVVVNWVAGVRN